MLQFSNAEIDIKNIKKLHSSAVNPIRFQRQLLLVIFILALVFSIALGKVFPAASQVPSPTPTPTITRQELVEEIKDYAERHVNSDTPMKTEFIIDLYRQNSVGLNDREIAEIYETEYERLNGNKKAQQNNPWSQFPQEITGWIAACLLFILLIFRDLFKDWLKKII